MADPQQPADPTEAVDGLPLTDLDDAALEAWVSQHGGKPFQARQIQHWLYRHGAVEPDQFRNLPKGLRTALAERGPIRGSTVATVDTSDDGTEKLLLRLRDGRTVECVLIPEEPRMTLCISSQVGCPVGCIFCASGLGGVERNLSSGEIVEQVLHARDRLKEGQSLTNVVVMGLGEPMLNLDNLMAALRRLGDPEGIHLGARRVTVSTSGYPRQIERFGDAGGSWNLAVSLHAAEDQLRKELVPTATQPVAEIVAAAQEFGRKTGREVTYEVVLLDGVNDRLRDAEEMVRVLAGKPCTVNLIPWNPVDEIPDLARPADPRVDAFAEQLRAGGLNVTVRRQRGADKSAACGQLRLRHETLS